MAAARRGIDPALCMGCGTDTTPCTNARGCRHKGRWEWYMVWPAIWAAVAGGAGAEGFLCIGCVEARLGRQLVSTDFTAAPVNWPHPWSTPRLAAALNRRPAPAAPRPVRPVRRFRSVVLTTTGGTRRA